MLKNVGRYLFKNINSQLKLYKYPTMGVFNFKQKLKKNADVFISQTNSDYDSIIQDIKSSDKLSVHEMKEIMIKSHISINNSNPSDYDLNAKLQAKEPFYTIKNQIKHEEEKIKHKLDKSILEKDLISAITSDTKLSEILVKAKLDSKLKERLNLHNEKEFISLIDEVELNCINQNNYLSHIYSSIIHTLSQHSEIKGKHTDAFTNLKLNFFIRFISLIKMKGQEFNYINNALIAILALNTEIYRMNSPETEEDVIINTINTRNEPLSLYVSYFLRCYYIHLKLENETNKNKQAQLVKELLFNADETRKIYRDLRVTEKQPFTKVINSITNYYYFRNNLKSADNHEYKKEISQCLRDLQTVLKYATSDESVNSLERHFVDLIEKCILEIILIRGFYYHSIGNSRKVIDILSKIDEFDFTNLCSDIFIIFDKLEKKASSEEVYESKEIEIKKRIYHALAYAYDAECSYRNSFNSAFLALKYSSYNNGKHILNNKEALDLYISMYLSKHFKYSFLYHKGIFKQFSEEEFALLLYIMNYLFYTKKNHLLSELLFEKIQIINSEQNLFSPEETINFLFTGARIYSFTGKVDKAIELYTNILNSKNSSDEDKLTVRIILSELALRGSDFDLYLKNLLLLSEKIIQTKTINGLYLNVVEKLKALNQITNNENIKEKVNKLIE